MPLHVQECVEYLVYRNGLVLNRAWLSEHIVQSQDESKLLFLVGGQQDFMFSGRVYDSGVRLIFFRG